MPEPLVKRFYNWGARSITDTSKNRWIDGDRGLSSIAASRLYFHVNMESGQAVPACLVIEETPAGSTNILIETVGVTELIGNRRYKKSFVCTVITEPMLFSSVKLHAKSLLKMLGYNLAIYSDKEKDQREYKLRCLSEKDPEDWVIYLLETAE